MKFYVVLDMNTLKNMAITKKSWLGDLFILQRREFNKNLILVKMKSNEITGEDYKYSLDRIHYFSGFALTAREIEYIEFEESMLPDEDHVKSVIKRCYEVFNKPHKRTKKLKKYLKEDCPAFRRHLIDDCLRGSSAIMESLMQKNHLENI